MDAESRERLLAPSDEGHRSRSGDSAETDSDLDATEFLDTDPASSDAGAGLRPQRGKRPDPLRPAFFLRCRSCVPSCLSSRSRCCLTVLAGLGALWLVLFASGAFVYKKYRDEPPYGHSPPWYPTPRGGTAASWAESYAKATEMVSRMTLAEKVNVTTGTGWMMGLAVGTTGPAALVGFPQLQLQDGPLGLRFADNATAFPAGITAAATWNKQLLRERGRAHGWEARAKGLNAVLGPCVGPLGRMPAGGRNWEGFGPDPYLQGVAAAETIEGIQGEGVMATIKHFVGNEQEHFRQPWEWGLPHAISSNIDDRTLHELYAWPFADAVRAGVASVMCSYNQINNSYACGNSKLLNGVLKDEMGFQGFVMSDWLAQRSGVATALAGLDMTMPGDGLRWANGESLWGPELSRAVLNGSVPVDRLDDMVLRIVAAWYQMGQDDTSIFDGKGPNFSSWTNERMGVLAPGSPTEQPKVEVNQYINVQADHARIAHQVAVEGTVLLKNNGNALPLSRQGRQVAPETDGVPFSSPTGTDEEHKKLRVAAFGEDAGPGGGPNACKDRSCNQGTLGSGWGSGAVEFPYLIPPVAALRAAFDPEHVEYSEYLTNSLPEPSILQDHDVCLVFANADAGEGFASWGPVAGDRPDLFLQKGGEDLVATVGASCGGGHGSTIVVIHAVGPVVMERWIDLPTVHAVLLANLPGQESGAALADVLFGNVSPSGKLPYTIGRSLDDCGPGAKVMYLPNGVVPQQDFSEGLFVDYRYFDARGIDPRFPFGHGLSYTSFALSNLAIEPVRAKSALPAPRPKPAAEPPSLSTEIPDAHEVAWPEGADKWRLEKYVYPYLDGAKKSIVDPSQHPRYESHEPSPAGGGEGGNPDLWETYVHVSVDVANTGNRDGQVVPQLYLSYPPSSDTKGSFFPVQVLRGFDKITLAPGQSTRVEFNLTRRDLSYWDVVRQNWVMVTTGQYSFSVKQSSRDGEALVGKW